MNTVTQIISVCAAAVLTGCATSYKPNGFDGGYSDTQLAPDLFRVVVHGNTYRSTERTRDFALLRAAELVQQHGFTCCAVVNENSSSQGENSKTPETAFTSGTIQTDAGGAYFTGPNPYNPGQIYDSYEPETGLLVRGFQTKPKGIFTFDVFSLQQTIRQEYGIK